MLVYVGILKATASLLSNKYT